MTSLKTIKSRRKKVAVFIGSRANYSSIKSALEALRRRKDIRLQILTGASAILDRFGRVSDLMEKDGFRSDISFHNLLEGSTPTTMAKSTGLAMIDAAAALQALEPDWVVVVGDRFEVMGVAVAAAYMNIRLAHTMGGEVSGTIDESIRHAITKLAHLHFVATEDAREKLLRMGEDPAFVHNVGCPRIDLVAREIRRGNSAQILRGLLEKFDGVGGDFSLNRGPFLLVSQHPVTTEYSLNRRHIEETLAALNRLKLRTIMLWPNADAGSDDIAAGIRTFRETHKADWLHLFKNLPTREYIHLMNETGCLIGNSSSGIREGAYIGTPVVNIGTRQNNRPCADNVVHVPHDADAIYQAVKKQLDIGKRPPNPLYGDGRAGERIAEILASAEPPIQKCLRY